MAPLEAEMQITKNQARIIKKILVCKIDEQRKKHDRDENAYKEMLYLLDLLDTYLRS
jgi:hypothetical protein